MPQINSQTKLNIVIGHPLEHSLSPALHNAVYEREGIAAVMLALDNASAPAAVRIIRDFPARLTAVTMPYKTTVMDYLDEIDAAAKKIGAVNTVINKEGKLYGYNTDIAGIAFALRHVEITGKKVALIGAGGAARPAAYHIRKKGGKLFILNRSSKKARILAEEFGGTAVNTKFIQGMRIDLLINATPLGMRPRLDKMPVEKNILKNTSEVFDMVYNPVETKLLKTARQMGIRIISGLDMFVAQGLEQERLWSGLHWGEAEVSYYKSVTV